MKNTNNYFSDLKFKHFAFGGVVLILLTFAVQIIFDIERERIEQSLRTLVTREATALILKLEAELNSNVYLVNGLIAYIHTEAELDESKVQIALKAVYEYGTHIRNVGVAPGNRLTYVYPREGNEAALGMYYPDNKQQWPAVEQAINAKETLLAGPLQLLQGGSGLISRTPVFLGDNSYWGILSLVLDADGIFKTVGLSPETEKLNISLRNFDQSTGTTNVFMGKSELFDSDSVFVSIQVPGGTWEMAAEPAKGWGSMQDHLVIIQFIAHLIVLLFCISMLINFRDRNRIESARKRLETILNTTQDGVIVFNSLGEVSEVNHSAEIMFGYKSQDILTLPIKMLIKNNSENNKKTRESLPEDLTLLNNTSTLMAMKQNGDIFPVDISVGKTQISDNTYYISTLKDVSGRKHAEAKLRLLATTDSLTNTLNRRAIMEAGENAFSLARRHNRPLSIMMLDADKFKVINDNYGHDSGDKVLIVLSKTIKQVLRNSDFFGRFGGEEFLIVLPETNISEAQIVASRLLEKIRQLEVATINDELIKFTVSIGLSEIAERSSNLQEIIHDADEALFEAKESGRNRAVCKVPSTNPDQFNLTSVPSREAIPGQEIKAN